MSRVLGASLLLMAAIASPYDGIAAQLGLTWIDNSEDEEGFKIERSNAPTGPFAQIGVAGPNVTSFTDSGLADDTTYCYRVQAYGPSGDSEYSNVACGATPRIFVLAVVSAGTGNGTVTSSPGDISCGASCSGGFPKGTAVTLTATPATGSAFTGWSGNDCAATGTCTVTLTAPTTLIATFDVTDRISVFPANITFTTPVGQVPPPQSISVTVPGGGTWSTNDTSPFYDSSQCWSGAGNTCPSGSSAALVPNALHIPTLAPGTYTAPITVMAPGFSNVVILVTLVVTAPGESS